MEEQILEFIHRRFPEDSHWLDGNCYWFARILSIRFASDLTIYYDPINGHFFVGEAEDGPFYDWSGKIEKPTIYIKWNNLCNMDRAWAERLWRDCAC